MNYCDYRDHSTLNLSSLLRMQNLVLIVLIYSGLMHEWYFNRLPAIMAVAPLVHTYFNNILLFPLLPAWWLLRRKSRKWDAIEREYMSKVLLLSLLMLIIVAVERIHVSRYDTDPSLLSCIPLMMLPVWICMGIWFTRDLHTTAILLHNLALAGATASVISFALRMMGFSYNSLLGPMYWPYHYIVAFGFFYYLSVWLLGDRGRKQNAIGILACSLEMLLTFEKRMIVSTALGILGLGITWAILGHGMRQLLVRRFAMLAACVGILALAVNIATTGNLVVIIQNIFATRWISYSDVQGANSSVLTIADRLGSGRLEMWKEIPSRIAESPWVGSGLYPLFEGAKVTHNGFIDVLLSVGIAGLLVLVVGAIYWAAAVAKSSPGREAAPLQLTCVSFIFCTFGGWIGLSAWMSFPTLNIYLCLLYGISLGLAARTQRRKSRLTSDVSRLKVSR
ncbi:O-antigen ligase family protein [bacterium]|nr:O-antigen ligase family protein [bacterium]